MDVLGQYKENIMDQDDTTYQRLKPKCVCWCTAHCGFSCMTDGCDCPDCECADCVDKGIQRGYN